MAGSELPTIEEEAQDLNAEEILEKRTRRSKDAATSQVAFDQPAIPKKKRKQAIRKLRLAASASKEEEVVAATELVIREMRHKQAEDAAALQRAAKLAQQVNIPVTRFAREDIAEVAEKVIVAAKEVQDWVASEAEQLLDLVVVSSEATISDSHQGNASIPHTDNVIEVESDSTPSISVKSPSSSSSQDLDNIPLGEMYPTLTKNPSPSSKTQKKPSTYEPLVPGPFERINKLAQRRMKMCEHLPPDHHFQPAFMKPINVIQLETNPEPQRASEVASEEVTSEDP